MQSTLLTLGFTAVFLFFLAYIVKTISDNNAKKSLVRDDASPAVIDKLMQQAFDPHGLLALKYGLVSVGVGLALMMIQLLNLRLEQPVTWGLLFLLAGAGYLLYFFIVRQLVLPVDDD